MLIFNDYSELGVPIAEQTPIIYVGRPYQGYPVINNY